MIKTKVASIIQAGSSLINTSASSISRWCCVYFKKLPSNKYYNKRGFGAFTTDKEEESDEDASSDSDSARSDISVNSC